MQYLKLSITWITFLFIALLCSQAQAVQIGSPLVDTAWLSANIDNVVVLDVRKDLDSFVTTGHIPGAVLVNWKEVRTSRVVDGVPLIKLVPTGAEFEALMQASGVNQDSAVVITSDGLIFDDVTFGTRLYWTLKYFGHHNMALLNGGTAKWIQEGGAVSTAASNPATGDFIAGPGCGAILATTDEVVTALGDSTVQLADVRDMNFYLGTAVKSYVYANGHIPGAKSFAPPLLLEWEAPATFVPTDLMAAALPAIGIDPTDATICYCNSGHQASGLWFLLHELMGNDEAQLYDGSLHEWTMDPGRPVSYMVVD